MKRSKGFTLIELLVVVTIIALLVAILMPTLARARELARQALCAANMKGIGNALGLYMHSEKEAWPKIDHTGGVWAPMDPDPAVQNFETFDGVGSGDYTAPFGADMGIWGEGIQQSLFLLVVEKLLAESLFLCPSNPTNEKADRGGTTAGGVNILEHGFAEDRNISYGMHWPKKTIEMNGGIAVMAGEGDLDDLDAQSRNHPKDGESVLYASFSVRFGKDESRTVTIGSGPASTTVYNPHGMNDNNIYRWDLVGGGGSDAGDQIRNCTEAWGTLADWGGIPSDIHITDSIIAWFQE